MLYGVVLVSIFSLLLFPRIYDWVAQQFKREHSDFVAFALEQGSIIIHELFRLINQGIVSIEGEKEDEREKDGEFHIGLELNLIIDQKLIFSWLNNSNKLARMLNLSSWWKIKDTSLSMNLFFLESELSEKLDEKLKGDHPSQNIFESLSFTKL